MAKNLGDAFVRVRPDTDGFENEAKGGLSSGLKKVAGLIASVFAGGAVIRGANALVGKASDLNETVNKSDIIFGKFGPRIKKWAASSATSLGLPNQAAIAAASSFGDMFAQIGFGNKQASKLSRSTVKMAADLGSFNNLETGDVLDRISAAMRGEYDSLQAVIPNISAARVEQVALARTGKAAAKELTAQEKAAATLAIIHKDGRRAMGDYGRTQDGLANITKTNAALTENLKTKVGQGLLPVWVAVGKLMRDQVLPPLTSLADKWVPKISAAIATWIGSGNPSEMFTKTGEALKGIDWSGVSSGFSNLVTAAKGLGPALGEAGTDVLGDGLTVFAVVTKFAADNVDLLAKALPFLAGGFVAYKTAQALANAAAILAIPTKIADLVITRQLTIATRQLAVSRGQLAATTTAGTAAENAGIIARVRSTVTTIASTVASKAAAVASRAWAATQWVLNAALTANPIGLVIAAIVGLVAGLVLAYKKSETFRNIVNGALSAVAAGFRTYFGIAKRIVTTYIAVIVAVVRAGINGVKGAVRGVVAIVGVIRGAFNSAKAGAQGALNGLMSFVRGIPGKILNVFSGAGSMLTGVGRNIVEGLISGIRASGGKIKDVLVGLLPGPLKKFAGKLGIASPSKVFAKFGKFIGQGFIKGIVGTREDVDKAFSDLVERVKKTSDKRLKELVLGTRKRLLQLGDIYGKVTDKLKDATDQLAQLRDDSASYAAGIRDQIIGTGDVSALGNTFKSIVSGLTKAGSTASKFTDVIAQLTAGGLNQTALGQLVAKGVDALPAAQAILGSGSAGIAQINSLQGQLAATANKLGTSVASTMYDAGIQIAQGLVAGLASQQAAIATQMTSIATTMVKKVRKHLKIKSPSQVFRQIGRHTGEGMALGVRDTTANVHKAVRGLAPTDGFDLSGRGRAGSAAAGGRPVEIHVHDKSGSPGITARETARHFSAAGIG